MKTRLIYIREEEMSDELGAIIARFTGVGENLLFFVELKALEDNNVPMISDLSDLRLNKAEQRIKDWLEELIAPELVWELVVFEGKPTKNNPDYGWVINQQKLKVFVHPANELRLIPFLKSRIAPDQLRFFGFEEFNTAHNVV